VTAAGADARRGLLVVIAGPSGVGKGTVHARVREALPDAWLSVSLTTRRARPGEREGVDYHFVDRPTFERAIADGSLLEWTEYAGNLYGTPLAPVDEAIAHGKVVVLDFELEGAFAVKAMRPDDTLTIALVPPSMKELERRLRARGTEDAEILATRLEVIREQMPHWDRFDRVIVNADLDRCVEEVLDAIAEARAVPSGDGGRPSS
jgi:guanylate kinase